MTEYVFTRASPGGNVTHILCPALGHNKPLIVCTLACPVRGGNTKCGAFKKVPVEDIEKTVDTYRNNNKKKEKNTMTENNASLATMETMETMETKEKEKEKEAMVFVVLPESELDRLALPPAAMVFRAVPNDVSTEAAHVTLSITGVAAQKRKRRTKAEMEADAAANATPEPELPPVNLEEAIEQHKLFTRFTRASLNMLAKLEGQGEYPMVSAKQYDEFISKLKPLEVNVSGATKPEDTMSAAEADGEANN